MKIHEYQAKAILARHGVPVPKGEVVFNAAEAADAARRLGGTVVVKAQIHAGGRGKGGGVKVVKNAQDAEAVAKAMIGMRLVTYQTGPDGQVVQRVLAIPTKRTPRRLITALTRPEIDALLAKYRNENGLNPRRIADEEIVERCIYALANEGARILEEGYAIRASDIDVIYCHGFGYPRHRGGPMFYADTVGLPTVLARVNDYRARFGDYWNPAPLVTLEFNTERNIGRVRSGRFTQQLVGTRLRMNFSPDLSIASYAQYDTDTDSVGVNTRLRWTFLPVADLFVVYNHNVRSLVDRWQLDSNQLLVKLQYTWRR